MPKILVVETETKIAEHFLKLTRDQGYEADIVTSNAFATKRMDEGTVDAVLTDYSTNGKRMLGWPVHVKDPKTGRTKIDPKTKRPVIKEQFYKRCSALDLPVAKRWIPPDQEKHPRNARFLDVTTATSLRECYDPNHYCTRTIDRKHKQRLAEYVGDELGLGKQVTAVHMIGMMVRVHHVADPARTAPQSKVADLLRFLGKGQGVNDNGTLRGDDDRCCHFDVKTADEHVDVFGDSFAKHVFSCSSSLPWTVRCVWLGVSISQT